MTMLPQINNAGDVPPPPYPGNDQYDLTPTPHTANRPRLPVNNKNLYLDHLTEDAKIVKFQTIVRESKEIVVGRIKVPTETSTGTHHAFILRRYDTNAISLTTMYKVAFPGASDEDERREMDWVKSSFDTRGTNGGRDSDAVRLAGLWISRNLAIHIAPAYNLKDLVAALARAIPDPNVAYRKSQRSQAASDELARQRDTSPLDAASQSAKLATEATSIRPAPVPSMGPRDTSSPASKRQRRDVYGAADGTAHTSQPVRSISESDDVRHITIEATTTIVSSPGAAVDRDAEIQQSKQLVQNISKEMQLRSEAGNELEDQGIAAPNETRGVKRVNGQHEAVAISGGAVNNDRVVRSNRRIPQVVGGEIGSRFGWGTLFFSVGLGASLTLFSQYASSLL